MQFTSIAAIALSAAAAFASPLEVRGGGGGGGDGWGSCSKDCQYTCTTNGILNVLTCASVLNGNVITIPITLLKRDTAMEGVQKRTGDNTCCTTDGLLNILTCVDLLDGNTITVPISVILGWL